MNLELFYLANSKLTHAGGGQGVASGNRVEMSKTQLEVAIVSN